MLKYLLLLALCSTAQAEEIVITAPATITVDGSGTVTINTNSYVGEWWVGLGGLPMEIGPRDPSPVVEPSGPTRNSQWCKNYRIIHTKPGPLCK